MNINKVQIAGNITKNIELKSLPNGSSVAQITLATNRTYTDKSDTKVEEVQYIDFVAFGKQAETLSKYCVKGQNMYFSGRIFNRSWDDKETGQKKYKTEIILEDFQFGQKPKGSENYSNEENDGADNKNFGNWDKGTKKVQEVIPDPFADIEVGGIDPNDLPF